MNCDVILNYLLQRSEAQITHGRRKSNSLLAAPCMAAAPWKELRTGSWETGTSPSLGLIHDPGQVTVFPDFNFPIYKMKRLDMVIA